MKILKIILAIVVVVALAFVGYLATLPSTYRVEFKETIAANPDLVMEHVANFKKWEKWSPWKEKDPNAAYSFEGGEGEVGSIMSWESSLAPDDSNQIGIGSMTLTNVEGSTSMNYNLAFVSPWEMSSKGGFTISEVEGGSEITWYDEGELGFFMRPLGQMMDEMMGPDFRRGLSNLKNHVEQEAADNSATNYVVEELSVESFYYIAVQDTCAVADLQPKMDEMFGKLMAHSQTEGIEPTGPPFAIYHSWDGSGTRFSTGMPVANMTEGKGEVSGAESYAGNVLKVTQTGSYETSEEAHMAVDKYAQENGKEITGSPWEVYVVGPQQEEDASKWVTDIYYPIK